MSDSPNSDDSSPSLSSYPPAFVSLITTFIRRAEEAETRAHKSLVILKAKDEQVIQLQKRMEVLEKIACRLEEVMVPPLDLPKSPQSMELSSPHPRDANKSRHPRLETLYQRYNAPKEKDQPHPDAHNCYEKCQYLIDGLERSNCQLREALTAESQQRVKDYEQYAAALAKVTQAFKDLQNKNNSYLESKDVQQCKGDNSNVPNEASELSGHAISRDEGDSNKYDKNPKRGHSKSCLPPSIKQINIIDKTSFENKKESGENKNSVLQYKLEKHEIGKNKNINKFKTIKSDKSVFNVIKKQSLSSHHSLRSSNTLKLKRVHISSHCYLNAMRKQNKKLKKRYYRICEKFVESLNLCEKLQKELVCALSKNRKRMDIKVDYTTQSIQTDDLICITLPTDSQNKTQSRSTSILQGRLDAAAKVMAKQCKQIQDLQKQLGESHGQTDSLRKRLARAEAAAAGKDMLGETTKKQLQELEKRNMTLLQEVQQMKDSYSCLRQELAVKIEECNSIKSEKEMCESEFEQMKVSLETKLISLSTALQQKEQSNGQMTNELQNKLANLREHFIAQVTEASNRLVAADFKIQELYLGIETFLKLLFSLNSPELSPASQAQAVQVASDILQLPAVEVQTILHSSRCDLRANRWIKECNRMVHDKVFAKNLGNLLLDAVLEAKLV